MLNLLTKPKPWMLASLIAATSVFGANNSQSAPTCPPKPCAKPCPQPTPPTQPCPGDPCCPVWPVPVLNAAYNYPARIQTRCPWDFFGDVSFIFWQPIQENLEPGFANTTASVGGTFPNGINGHFVNMDFEFKPGFKIGLGGNFERDNWDMRLEYTWFHNTNSKSYNAPQDGQIIPTAGHPDYTAADYTALSQSWPLKMDILDLNLGRWYYVGTKLTFHPTVGLRADWIRQKLSTTYTRPAVVAQEIVADETTITQNSRSWALGPKVGLDANWNIGWGFRFFGNTEADLLFTDYTHLSFSQTRTTAGVAQRPFKAKECKEYAVKPHCDVELGFGWGTYLDCNNWYMDFALGYEFQVFFDQNVFRQFNNDVMVANSNLPNGNLYLQGLTATFRLDF